MRERSITFSDPLYVKASDIERSLLTVGDFRVEGKVLRPKDDLTPIELWNIYRWVESLKHNYVHLVGDKLWQYAIDLKIDRHFENTEG